MQSGVTLTINPDGTVAVLCENGGTVARRETTLAAVAEIFHQAVQDSAREEKWLATPLLPPGVLAYRENQHGDLLWVAVEWGPEILPFAFFDTVFQEVPYPRLVFDFGLRRYPEGLRVHSVYLAALPEGEPLKPDTRLYRYPYSHVAVDGRMCTGDMQLPAVKDLTELTVFPRLVLTTPNEDHHYGDWVNRSGLPLRGLLQEVNGLEAFPAEWLLPMEITLGEWLARRCW